MALKSLPPKAKIGGFVFLVALLGVGLFVFLRFEFMKAKQEAIDKEHQAQALLQTELNLVRAQVRSPEELQKMYDAAFARGEYSAKANLKPDRIVQYKTKEVVVDSPCDPDQSLVVNADVAEAHLENREGDLFVQGGVTFHMSYTGSNWKRDFFAPIDRKVSLVTKAKEPLKPEDFKPMKVEIVKRWHVGNGCVVGPSLALIAAEDLRAHYGIGGALTCGWGAVK